MDSITFIKHITKATLDEKHKWTELGKGDFHLLYPMGSVRFTIINRAYYDRKAYVFTVSTLTEKILSYDTNEKFDDQENIYKALADLEKAISAYFKKKIEGELDKLHECFSKDFFITQKELAYKIDALMRKVQEIEKSLNPKK